MRGLFCVVYGVWECWSQVLLALVLYPVPFRHQGWPQMSSYPYTSERLIDDATYEIGMAYAQAWVRAGWLSEVEIRQFQTALSGQYVPVVGRLDDGADDWINSRL